MSELTAKRWEKGNGDPAEHPPVEALDVARFRMESGEAPDHAIVVWGYTDKDGGQQCVFTQAGSYSVAGQLGLLMLAQKLIAE